MKTYAMLSEQWSEAVKLRDHHAAMADLSYSNGDTTAHLLHILHRENYALKARMLYMRMAQMAEANGQELEQLIAQQ